MMDSYVDVGCGRKKAHGRSKSITSGIARRASTVISRELGSSIAPIDWLPRLIARSRPCWCEEHLAVVFPGRNIGVEFEFEK